MDAKERKDLEQAAEIRREAVIRDRAERLRHFLVAEYRYGSDDAVGNLQTAMLGLMVDAQHLASLDRDAGPVSLELAGRQARHLAQEERFRVPLPATEESSSE